MLITEERYCAVAMNAILPDKVVTRGQFIRPSNFVLGNQQGTPCRMTPSKARRVTQLQQEMLLQFMQENPEFAARRAIHPLNRALYDQKWEELAITLNSGEGSQKSVAEWRKVGESPPLDAIATSLPKINLTWSDWRKNVRLKAMGGKDGEVKTREGARILSCVERRLLELVGIGTPPKQTNAGTATPVTQPSTIEVASRPMVNYSLPQPILPPQQSPTNFPIVPSTVFPLPTDPDDDVEVLDEIESDPESSYATVGNSRDDCPTSQRSSPQHVHFPRQAAEAKRVGGVGMSGIGVSVEGGSRGVWRHGNLEERRLALEERRLQLDERRLKLEERRVQHEEWRATMDRESHQVDMDMKRALLKHMRRTETN